MPRLSSIFSFDTLAGVPRPTRAVYVALAICVVFRLGLYAARDRLEDIPAPNAHRTLLNHEDQLIRAALVKPRIVLMGSSQTLYGLHEDRLAAAAGLQPGEVVNLAVETGRAWDATVLLRRNPEFFENVELVVFDVALREVAIGSFEARKHLLYRLATLEEKCRADSWLDKGLFVADWLWPFKAERRDLATWLVGLSGRQGPKHYPPLKEAWIPDKMAILMNRKAEFLNRVTSNSIESTDASVRQTSEFYRKELCDFIAYWRERRKPVLLIGYPVASFAEKTTADPAATREGVAFTQFIESMTGNGVAYIKWRLGREIGLDDQVDFFDEIHLTPTGAEKMTATVAGELDRLGWLALARSPSKPQTDRKILARTSFP